MSTSSRIRPCPLPTGALLNAYRVDDTYADCFATDFAGAVSHEQFVTAFYTTWVFKLERAILALTVSRPSTDDQARQLGAGTIDDFAAWHVEKRCPDQLLLADFPGKTRSWLMAEPIALSHGQGTRLYFGSAVVPHTDRRTGKKTLGSTYRVLLGFHKVYSVILLRAARSRLKQTREH